MIPSVMFFSFFILELRYPKKLSEAPPVPMRALFWQRIAPDELDGTVRLY
jgi:hypothetical protein